MGGDDAQEKRALQQFKEALRDIWQEKFTDPYLLRWLRARDFDVTKAEELLRKNLRWREENKVDTLIERYECHPVLKKYFPGGIFNHDRDGCPVYIVPVGHGDFRGMLQCLSKEDLVRHMIYTMEMMQRDMDSQTRKLGKTVNTAFFLFDYEGFSLKQVYSWQVLELMRSLTALYENNYPETLKIGLLINTPSFFPIFWKIVRPFITARTANKLHMFTRDGWQDVLLKHVDRSQLPAHWGGTIVDPVGGARCTQVIGPGGELPATVWRGGGGLATDPEAVNCFLERGRSIEVPVQVEAAGAELHWRFQARDVAFALWRTSGESRVQVLAPRRIACDRDAECGQMQCDEPGTYTFLFDNSFSWFTGKQLSYVIRVHHESFASVKATIQC
ncbi:SEC14-like protein 2 isoform X1 [Dermacentor albipictus]|uniref:SEC14-like protein 2 isoform X1 n=1 Tax=Dermacentor albipictus TaxID=60249 RepID=UPI0031FC9C99